MISSWEKDVVSLTMSKLTLTNMRQNEEML